MAAFKSPYRRGADNGLTFGSYLSVLFLATAYSQRFEWLSPLALAMVVGVPVVIWFYLRRSFREDGGKSEMSALWMEGIMTFLCGSSISGVVAYIYMRWINPTYIVDTLRQTIALYSQMDGEQAQQLSQMLTMLLDSHQVPSVITIAFQSIWMAVLTGSILSLVLALIIRGTAAPRPPKPPRTPRPGE